MKPGQSFGQAALKRQAIRVEGSRKTRAVIVTVAGIAVLGVLAVAVFRGPGTGEEPGETLEQRLEKLRSVPYTSVTREVADETRSGVVRHDTSMVFGGYNLYCSRVSPEVFLMDMTGRVVHTWSRPEQTKALWEHAVMLENGDLIVIDKYSSLMRLDWNSEMIWQHKMEVHHDFAILEDGTIYVILRDGALYRGLVIRFPVVARITQDGHQIERWSTHERLFHIRQTLDPRSFLDTLLDSIAAQGRSLPFAETVPGSVEIYTLEDGTRLYDYFHLNTLTVLQDTPLGRGDNRFRAGNLLLCFRNVNQIAVLDMETKKIQWAWGEGNLEWPHHPTLLAGGNILVFDNGVRRKFSRVLEVDPRTDEIVWEYKADPPESFYTFEKGSAQRLPNGNTLVCDGDNCRAIEVTHRGEIAWEWINPAVHKGHRVQIYRIERIPAAIVDPLLKGG
jgi:hypothetical protein